MSKRLGIWGPGSLLSGLLSWFKGTAGRYWQFACGIAGRSRKVRLENGFGAARPMNTSKTIQVDFAGGLVEFKEFTEVLRIGDRIRVFCDDGVIEAEKISPSRFKLIYAVETTGPIQ